MLQKIYLDHNSTTPVAPEVLEAMLPYFSEKFGNAASSSHTYGWEANVAVEMARENIAKNLGAPHKESIIFTSGATESNNLALKGLAEGANKKIHIITQKTEHKCILDSCEWLENQGHEVTYLDVDEEGFVSPDDVRRAIRSNTLLCSIMYANNEIGTIQPIQEIATICHEQGIWLHSDAAQAVGHSPVNVKTEGIDLLSFSAHKIYGPKGIGALYVNQSNPPIPLKTLLHGGGHERGLRSGTLNVPGIVGMAKALELCVKNLSEEQKRLTALRNHFIKNIQQRIQHVTVNGSLTHRLAHNASLTFNGMNAEQIILDMKNIACSTGSACSSGSTEPSYVIKALGHTNEYILSTLRFGLGRHTTKEELDTTVDKLVKTVEKLRSQSITYQMKKD